MFCCVLSNVAVGFADVESWTSATTVPTLDPTSKPTVRTNVKSNFETDCTNIGPDGRSNRVYIGPDGSATPAVKCFWRFDCATRCKGISVKSRYDLLSFLASFAAGWALLSGVFDASSSKWLDVSFTQLRIDLDISIFIQRSLLNFHS